MRKFTLQWYTQVHTLAGILWRKRTLGGLVIMVINKVINVKTRVNVKMKVRISIETRSGLKGIARTPEVGEG